MSIVSRSRSPSIPRRGAIAARVHAREVSTVTEDERESDEILDELIVIVVIIFGTMSQ